MKTIPLGSLARDIVTGFTGVIIGKTQWLNGCNRVTIQPRELKDGKPIESHCFDIEQIEILGPAIPEPIAESAGPGGPKPSPTRSPDPAR
jgi:hypothetical protein